MKKTRKQATSQHSDTEKRCRRFSMNHRLYTFTGNPEFRSGFKEQNQRPYMQDRVRFKTSELRKTFFLSVKKAAGAESWRELRGMFDLPRTSFGNYQYGIRLLSVDTFDSMLLILPQKKQQIFFKETITKPGNWGAKKGGSKGIKTLLKKYGKKTVREWRQKAGRKSIRNLNAWMKQNPEKAYILLRKKKLQKSDKKLKENTKKFEPFFTNKTINFDLSEIESSKPDIKRELRVPKRLCPLLAEEIGIHLGDGTLSKKRYYYSVRGDLNEESYYTGFILPLYKELYNIKPPLLKRSFACGFEISSKMMREFKNKVLDITVGTKTYKIKVPTCIMESRDKEIMCAFLRGLYDTDGCYYFHKKNKYTVISLYVKSKELINKVCEMIILLGFSPQVCSEGYAIHLNGISQFRKWIKEIGSSNPKHLKRIENIKNTLPWSSLDRLFKELNNPSKDAGLRKPFSL